MDIRQKINRKTQIITLLGILSLLFYNCSSDTGPVSGCYKIQGQDKYAVVIDSTLYFMCGFDTAFIYDLKFMNSYMLFDSVHMRKYGILFSDAVTRHGFRNLECPLIFEGNKFEGSLPIVKFKNNESFYLGGYHFLRQQDDAEMIFNKWVELVINNNDAKILRSL